MSLKKESWIVAALDAITQFRATNEPLKNVVKRLGAERRLGSKERSRMTELAFGWLRIANANQEIARATLKERGFARPSQRQIDELIIEQLLSGETLEKNVLPDWFVRRLERAYPDQVVQLIESLQQRADPTLAIDKRYVSVATVTQALTKLGVANELCVHVKDAIQITGGPFRLALLPDSIAAHVWFMDEASQLAAESVGVKEGHVVLDYCAGGGGKTRFLASRGAQVIAMDLSEKRLQSAKERVAKDEVTFVVADGCYPPFKESSFDSILVDAPCTGTGTIRRAPDLLSRLNEKDVDAYVELQRDLLRAAFKLLSPQGRLIYSTCSVLVEENQDQVDWAARNLAASVVSLKQLLPSHGATDGFFIAELQRRGK